MSEGVAVDNAKAYVPSDVKTCLLVIAHPDDECMFFTPFIIYNNVYNMKRLEKDGAEAEGDGKTETAEDCERNFGANKLRIKVLCLTGDAVRSKELIKSLDTLNIPETDVMCINSVTLPDSMSRNWCDCRVIGYVEAAVRLYDISSIVTFDKKGVSGHINHISIPRALFSFRRTLRSPCERYVHKNPEFVSIIKECLVDIGYDVEGDPADVMQGVRGDVMDFDSCKTCDGEYNTTIRCIEIPTYQLRTFPWVVQWVLRAAFLLLNIIVYPISIVKQHFFNDLTIHSSRMYPPHILGWTSVDPFLYVLSSGTLIFLCETRTEAKRAFHEHSSQQAWFRHIWFYISSYTFCNVMNEMDQEMYDDET